MSAALSEDRRPPFNQAEATRAIVRRSNFAIVAQNLAALFVLAMMLPFNLFVVTPCWMVASVRRCLQGAPGVHIPGCKSVLISGGKMTKALQLARSFHRAGHRVVLCETSKYAVTGHRFSNAVDKFCIVDDPRSPAYAESLRRIVREEAIDVYVPVCSPLASRYDSAVVEALEGECDVLHPHPSIIDQLDDKYQFAKTAEAFGLRAPKSYLITHPSQVIEMDFSSETRPFILKSIPYDAIRRLDLTKLPGTDRTAMIRFVKSLPISPANPWVLQEFIEGDEFCTHSTVVDGQLRLHCCCRSSAFQINYEHIDEPEIERWVQAFVAGLNVTGQVSFDFLRAHDDGQFYAIECNPRTHSAITTFYGHAGVADAYFVPSESGLIVKPPATSKPTYWIYHELEKLVRSLARPKEIWSRLMTIANGKDAIFDARDPLPFLLVHHYHIPLLLIDDLRHLKGWKRIDFNIGKLVQLGGD